ncbi:phosphoribosylglycinamide formyltransferase [Lactobacillus sp. LC28-10]|uniref:Phosphoribosylglycinamide formyltransferase n=1 Tax=Secundilactobacillus angelensis TaxID=2722706 RepID=A0ABX1KZ12_9LACO|nr:phosphoribosylglycinamide formyltransferase [Secundilactobacillus angelensis]MCH5463254.1 phosphoribosylglycinamide formyltransferase [Secundilactobacillus angelensis]NLR19182.1 phosphoribosylglycinamide formyltransferase [Secundilactobacillus angelensis]
MSNQSNTESESRIAVFASGNGTNFEALVNANLPAKICVLVCDNPDVPVIQRAKHHHIPVILSVPEKGVSKAAREQSLLENLTPYRVTGLVLAGYMRIVGPTLLSAFPRRIINIHPALLPSFPGRHGIEDAYKAGVRVTGVTIHYVDGGVDTGEIIAQEPVYRTDQDTLTSLEAKIHSVEHQLYPKTVRQLIQKGVL